MTDDDLGSGARDVAATTIGDWLAQLGSSAPAPGGGAAAAVNAALGAALVEMVCNLTIGRPKFAQFEEHVTAIRDAARKLRAEALTQVRDDAAAFTTLMASYRLPRETPGQQASREREIQSATRLAASVPLEIAGTGARVVELAAGLPGRSNPNLLSDVAVAATCAAAAIEAAAVNVEVNLAGMKDRDAKAELADRLAVHLAAADQARRLVADVRRETGE
ncbi:MAG: cyclodeaminase/cyclohydrolase family protein [Micromonosporaceae bacterium]